MSTQDDDTAGTAVHNLRAPRYRDHMTEIEAALKERDSAERCPGCGHEGSPDKSVACAERIHFYTCLECGFSTWDRSEYR